jgi:ATP-dependent Lon protease
MRLEDYEESIDNIPAIVIYNNFLYPFMIVPIFLDDEPSIKAASWAVDNNTPIAVVVSQSGSKSKDENIENIYDIAIIGTVMRKVLLPDGRVKLLFQGVDKARIDNLFEQDGTYFINIDKIQYEDYNEKETSIITSMLLNDLKEYSKLTKKFPADLIKTIESTNDPIRVADLIASVINLKKDDAYRLLKENIVENRLLILLEVVKKLKESISLEKEINKKVNVKLDKVHKQYMLKEQLKEIQKELGVDNKRQKEINSYKKQLKSIKSYISKDGYKEVKTQIDKLSKMNPESPDANTLQTYLDQVFEIPFGKYASEDISIEDVATQLDNDHYGLEKPKDRIVEYFAVKELIQKRAKDDDERSKTGTVLCFVGPPGVGKTSLANSISKALQRPLMRVALGGMDDVSELRGHRRTYVGAMASRIVNGLCEAKVMNPVVVLDEIDKLGKGYKGDPSAVMLEILDPEQNVAFRDMYLNFHIDLSKALFVATANDLRTIPPALKDRMEFIEVSSYTPDEKYHIAKSYLIPQELKKHAILSKEVGITKTTIEAIIEKYTREAGVRNLRRVFAKIFRKIARKLLIDRELKKVNVNTKNLKSYLDNPIFEIEKADKIGSVGIGNGLAWTAVGGDVLKIEAIKIRGKGDISITGNLGDVMKESARISYMVVKSLIDSGKLPIDVDTIAKTTKEIEEGITPDVDEVYRRVSIHLHIPEGATPKDGPSAGTIMSLTLASLLSNRAIKSDIAMTGEITLSGKVLPIGGLKEKLIAAYKAKMDTVLIPRKNYQRDLEDIPDEVKNNMKIVAVDTIDDVIKIGLI